MRYVIYGQPLNIFELKLSRISFVNMFRFHSIFVIFQANCPDYQPDVPLEEKRKAYYFGEDMTWEPGRIHDHDLVRFIRLYFGCMLLIQQLFG